MSKEPHHHRLLLSAIDLPRNERHQPTLTRAFTQAAHIAQEQGCAPYNVFEVEGNPEYRVTVGEHKKFLLQKQFKAERYIVFDFETLTHLKKFANILERSVDQVGLEELQHKNLFQASFKVTTGLVP